MTLQCWDADVVSADDFLGSIQLDLTRMIKGADTAKACRLSMLKNKNRPTVNLFKEKNVRGWWPMAVFEGDKPGRLAVYYTSFLFSYLIQLIYEFVFKGKSRGSVYFT